VTHHPYTEPVLAERDNPASVRFVHRAVCSCGWKRSETNTQRENAMRVARRHVEERSRGYGNA
jgi:hypothetical protein